MNAKMQKERGADQVQVKLESEKVREAYHVEVQVKMKEMGLHQE